MILLRIDVASLPLSHITHLTIPALLAAVLSGCVAQEPSLAATNLEAADNLESTADLPAPKYLSATEQWIPNSDGYVYSAGYFTPEQERSPAWERLRLESHKRVRICAPERLARREVRWFEPIAPGEPRCAVIVYGFECPLWRTKTISSLDYDMLQVQLDEPDEPPSSGCGEKDLSNVPQPLNDTSEPRGVIINGWANCKPMPDIHSGKFRLDKVTYINSRAFVSPSFVRAVVDPYPNAVSVLAGAALWDQRVHLIQVQRPLPDNGHNIFIEQTFASDGQGFCAALTARQGANRWRKTVRSDEAKPQPHPTGALPGQLDQNELAKALQLNPIVPAKRLDQYEASQALQLDLADYLGIDTTRARQPN